jgi:hypothetical protein
MISDGTKNNPAKQTNTSDVLARENFSCGRIRHRIHIKLKSGIRIRKKKSLGLQHWFDSFSFSVSSVLIA